MKTSYYLMIISVFLLSTTACEDNDGNNNNGKVVGTGPIVTNNLDLSSFTKIENTGVANFYITYGNPQSVVLKAQQNIMDVMTYEVVNHILKVGVKDNVSIENHEEIRFDITIPEINRVELTGVGDFEFSGDYQDELTIILTGVGNVKAYDLEVGTCNITSTGVGICEVRVTDELNVSISGVGSVYYKGEPTINSIITGVGQLVEAN